MGNFVSRLLFFHFFSFFVGKFRHTLFHLQRFHRKKNFGQRCGSILLKKWQIDKFPGLGCDPVARGS